MRKSSPRACSASVRRSQPGRSTRLHLERLDDRSVPANLVTAQLLGTNLVITGLDDLTDLGVLNGDNNQVVAITGIGPGAFTVDVGGATEFLLPGKVTSKATQFFKGVTSIKIDMRLGDDVVFVNNANLSGELSFTGGHGNDQLIIGGVAGNQTFGKITINNGDGDDIFQFGRGSNKVLGDVKINNGVGNSQVVLNVLATDELAINGSLSVSNGDGSDLLQVGGKNFAVGGNIVIANGNGPSDTAITPTGKATVGGMLSITNGEGFDHVALGFNDGLVVGQFVVGKGVVIRNKGGGSQVMVDGTVTIQGKLDIQSGDGFDSLFIGNQTNSSLTINGSMNVATGNGSSELFVGGAFSNITGGVTLVNAAGFDNIQFSPGSLNVGGPLSISNGTGGSYVGLSPNGALSLAGGATITNAAGQDTLVIGGAKTTTISAKSVTANHGHGGSSTFLSAQNSISISGAVTVNALDGHDTFSLSAAKITIAGAATFKAAQGDAEAFFTPTVSQNIGGPIAVDSGAGNLVVVVGSPGSTTTSKGLSWLHGNGATQVFLEGNVQVNGNVTGKAGEGFAKISVLDGLTVTGAVSITNGPGGSETLFAGPTKVSGSFTLNNGDGADIVEIGGPSFDVLGAVTINQGIGDSSPPAVAALGPSLVKIAAGKTVIGGGLTIKALSGDDVVQLDGLISAKSLTVDLGAGRGDIQIADSLTVSGNLLIQLGDADDDITVPGNVNVGGTTTIRTGAGDDQVLWYGGVSLLQGAVTIDTGDGADEIAVQGWTVKAATKVSLGSGNDTLFIDNSIFAAVNLDAGSGSDQVYIETQDLGGTTTFNGVVSVNLGDGDDLMIVSISFDTDDFAVFNGAVNVNGGAGLDQVYANVDRDNVFLGPAIATNVEVLA